MMENTKMLVPLSRKELYSIRQGLLVLSKDPEAHGLEPDEIITVKNLLDKIRIAESALGHMLLAHDQGMKFEVWD
jgi:hypothetical protein